MGCRLLRQSTTVTIDMGPALDRADAYTEETGLSPTVYLSKAGGAQAARNSATAITHDARGYYRVELNATDTGTLGMLRALFHDSATHLPVWEYFMVIPSNVYDSLVAGSDNLEVDAILWRGTQPNTLQSGRVDAYVGAMAANVLTSTAINDGALTAAKFAAGAFDAVWTVASRTLTAFSTALAVSVWDVLASAVAAANSIGLQIKTNLDAVLSTRASQTSVDDIPTNSEFNARTLASASYATASAQTTAQTSLTAIEAAIAALENLSQAESQAAAEAALAAFGAATAALFTTTTRSDPSALAGSLGSELTPFAKLDWLAARILRENTFNKDTGVLTVKNAAGTDIASSTCSDDGTTTTRPQLGAP